MPQCALDQFTQNALEHECGFKGGGAVRGRKPQQSTEQRLVAAGKGLQQIQDQGGAALCTGQLEVNFT